MGKCECSEASIGIKILLSDLILQINENNFFQINQMINNGFIEDENEYFNEVYEKIINSNKVPKDYIEFKDYLQHELQSNGSYYKHKFTNEVTPTLDNGCLFDKYLLVPIKEILVMSRWGYDRYGTNSVSRVFDFDLSANIEEYKEIEKKELVFLLKQNSG
jgi:hypothetical protein